MPWSGANPLKINFYDRDTVAVARELLGKVLVHDSPDGVTAGIIVETEAYLHDDPASHTYRGRTKRNAVMFGPPGRAYVYLIYGIHYCFNAVCREEGCGEAVLVRSVLPFEGLLLMQKRRGKQDRLSIANGPGNLCKAMGIEGMHNGISLVEPPLYIVDGDMNIPGEEIVATGRVGITRGTEKKLRFLYVGDEDRFRKGRVL
ncbi:MAG: DNA-3-methyladenine glycosylase [Firmicutes bacterium]|jgi:DNA-3-methyladenine glycosylase|nr:DNA-3-methyladenine glycosylase [Bacillota bacterium]